MSELHALVRSLERAMNERRPDDLDDVLTDGFVRHCQATPGVGVRSREEFKAFLAQYDAAFPDNVQTFTHIAAEGDLIGVFATYEGTHTGPLGPVAPTGKRVMFDFAGVFRVEDGRLAEFRVTWDNMTVLGQLGLLGDGA